MNLLHCSRIVVGIAQLALLLGCGSDASESQAAGGGSGNGGSVVGGSGNGSNDAEGGESSGAGYCQACASSSECQADYVCGLVTGSQGLCVSRGEESCCVTVGTGMACYDVGHEFAPRSNSSDEEQQFCSQPSDLTPPAECVPDGECAPRAIDTGDPHSDCIATVNQYRACLCLPPVERRTDAEACANEQAEYDASNGSHAAYFDEVCMPRGCDQLACSVQGGPNVVVGHCVRGAFEQGPPESEPCDAECLSEHGSYQILASRGSLACGFFEEGNTTTVVLNFYP